MTETNAERAYLAIKDRIIKTDLSPGEVIQETRLREDFMIMPASLPLAN